MAKHNLYNLGLNLNPHVNYTAREAATSARPIHIGLGYFFNPTLFHPLVILQLLLYEIKTRKPYNNLNPFRAL